jgi:adenylate cyclase
MFGVHVSPAVVQEILKTDDPKAALNLKGTRVNATIFYSDIRGFTAMSETMTPEEIYTQLNQYFDAMCKIIFKYGGYVDKFIGDCIMAVFSAPFQTPDDAAKAVRAAVEQQALIKRLSDGWQANGKKAFTVGMGINTGDVVMGNLGASSRMNYTVIGDNVNVASRLYNVAKGGEIIISESTYEHVRDLVEVDEREPVMVKGKSAPIRIYNVTGIKGDGPSSS